MSLCAIHNLLEPCFECGRGPDKHGEPVFLKVGDKFELCRFPSNGEWSVRERQPRGDVAHIRYLTEFEVQMVESAMAQRPSLAAPQQDDARDAERWRFCAEYGFPTRNQTPASESQRWTMQGMDFGKNPTECVDAAIDAARRLK